MTDAQQATKWSVSQCLRQQGFSELACQFAQYIERVEQQQSVIVTITAALLTEAVSQGHVCLNLLRTDGLFHAVRSYLPEQVADWIAHLEASNVVGKGDDYRPLMMSDEGLVYLYRHWHDERCVAKRLTSLTQSIELNNVDAIQQQFSQWPTTIEGIDWQKVAVVMALTRQFCVIAGGPGTGKTTVVVNLLGCLQQQNPTLRVALAAPTGKAATRLQHVISDNDDQRIQAKTIHRLLGISPSNEQGRYHQQRSLPFDVVIVDEASMIDISLMAILLQALSPSTRLILLGDSQQLASVESGAVLANLCESAVQFDADFAHNVNNIAGIKLDQYLAEQPTMLTNSVVKLQHSYRFDQHSLIGRLANAVQRGDSEGVITELQLAEKGNKAQWQRDDSQAFILGYQPYFDAINAGADAEVCLAEFERYRVLCALKQGPQSVSSVNWHVQQHIAKLAWRSQHDFYHGRPIMITQNDYRQQLFNGDTGVILNDGTGQLRACFRVDNTLRWVDLIRLPSHETAFAITVHKSQGSEFECVCIVLPQEESTILNRELLYTAITRAKQNVLLHANEMIIRKTVQTQHQRESGLAGLLASLSPRQK
jgi:exodeoxyribonuclease V alpha subunit